MADIDTEVKRILDKSPPLHPHYEWLMRQALRIIGEDYDVSDEDVIEEMKFLTIVKSPSNRR